MSPTIKVWLHSLIAAAIGGAAASIGAMVADPKTFTLTGAGFKSLADVAAAGALTAVAALLRRSPLPSLPEQPQPPQSPAPQAPPASPAPPAGKS